MARLGGLAARFSMTGIREYVQGQVDQIEQKTLEALQYQGEEFVNKARNNQTYTDRTGNLRSSIGYLILKDGGVIDQNFTGTDTGRQNASKVAKEVGTQFPRGYVLIGVAGMSYAAAVESKGYDVITGSAPMDNELRELLGAIKP